MALERDGTNLSAGERQLLCLARAALHDGGYGCALHTAACVAPLLTHVLYVRLLIFDEATAHVDPEAEAICNRVIHHTSSTVLSICHKLAVRGWCSCCGLSPLLPRQPR